MGNFDKNVKNVMGGSLWKDGDRRKPIENPALLEKVDNWDMMQ